MITITNTTTVEGFAATDDENLSHCAPNVDYVSDDYTPDDYMNDYVFLGSPTACETEGINYSHELRAAIRTMEDTAYGCDEAYNAANFVSRIESDVSLTNLDRKELTDVLDAALSELVAAREACETAQGALDRALDRFHFVSLD